MITVYSKQRCPKCDEVKDYLEREGHVFKSVDITNDLIKLQEFRTTYVGAGFPVVDFCTEVIAGDVEAIKAKADTLN
jgi:glutaredoxin